MGVEILHVAEEGKWRREAAMRVVVGKDLF